MLWLSFLGYRAHCTLSKPHEISKKLQALPKMSRTMKPEVKPWDIARSSGKKAVEQLILVIICMCKGLEMVKMLYELINVRYSPFDLATLLTSPLVAFRGKERLVFSFSLAGVFCFALAGPWGCPWSFPSVTVKLFKIYFSLIYQDTYSLLGKYSNEQPDEWKSFTTL